MNRLSTLLFLGIWSGLSLPSPASATLPPGDEIAIVQTLKSFQEALREGDPRLVMNFFAEDAIIMESGVAQTRGEYEREHLSEDIEFARAVKSVRSETRVETQGSAAWATSKLTASGVFDGRRVKTDGVELIVLTKVGTDWKIRAIHWSSHRAKAAG